MSAAHAESTEAQLRVAEELNADRILTHALASRPKSTKNAFEKKQAEFIKWARMKGYPSPETVTEAKVALFLEERVVDRTNRNDSSKIIGKSSIDQYITALTSLWKYQVERKINSHPTPRGEVVKNIQKTFSRNIHKVRKATYYDRGLLYQHLLNNERRQQRQLIADYFWRYGDGSISLAFKGLRNRVGYLLSEQGLLRGENIRDLQFPDFFCIEMDKEGPSTCIAMAIIKGRGKMNQFGKPLFSGYYRHADVWLCSVSSVALYLFYRFHVCNEPFPDFSVSQSWYDICMFCTHINQNTKAFSASAHALAIIEAKNRLKILDPKNTHGGRVYGRQKLEQSGVDKVSADVAGGWSTGAGEACYGNGFSRPAMRAMAGFPPNETAFYLPRSAVRPPDALLKKVFPQLDEWQRRHLDEDSCQQNFALDGFLRLLTYFREVIIQDVAVMMDNGMHPVFNHPLFSSDEFMEFKNSLYETTASQQNPIDMDIERVIPQLCRQIAINNEALKDHIINAVNKAALQMSQKFDKSDLELRSSLNCLRTALTSCLSNAVNTLEQIQPVVLTPDSTDTVTQTTHYVDVATTAPSLPVSPVVPSFNDVISTAVNTVPEVLLEWEVGLNGRPSVSMVERQWNTKWRMGSQNQKAFSRRRLIVGLIEHVAQRKAISTDAAACFIEERRLQKHLSIIQLADKWRVFESTELT